jgi:hypothetical protein
MYKLRKEAQKKRKRKKEAKQNELYSYLVIDPVAQNQNQQLNKQNLKKEKKSIVQTYSLSNIKLQENKRKLEDTNKQQAK